MLNYLRLFALGCCCVILCSSFHPRSVTAQTRSIGAQAVILDDGSGHLYKLVPPSGLVAGSTTFAFPSVPPGPPTAGWVTAGVTSGQTLYWDGTAWSPASNLFNDFPNGRIGINNTTPLACLDVRDAGITLPTANIAITNAGNSNTALTVNTAGAGAGVRSTSSGNMGLWGITNSVSGAGVLADNTAGGEAITGRTTSDIAGAVVGRNDGNGFGVKGYVPGFATTGIGVYGLSGLNGNVGTAGKFENLNSSNSSDVLVVTSNGTGRGMNLTLTNAASSSTALMVNTIGTGTGILSTSAGGMGVWGVTNSPSGTGILGDNTSGGEAVTGRTTSDVSAAIVGRNDGSGFGIKGFIPGAGKTGIGVYGLAGNGGNIGIAGKFENVNSANTSDALLATTNGSGNALVATCSDAGASTTSQYNCAIFKTNAGNVARIDNTGEGWFDGGTTTGGADVAEAFSVEGETTSYEPGDVLVISTSNDRTVERCESANSTLVVGVYATKPGVLLTPRKDLTDMAGMVPMGVVGVIPTKVTNENGTIHRGDLLVTSTRSGHAMKAGANPSVGTVIGKALENFDKVSGKINVLVNVR